jgi:hypothetical protein
MISLSSRKHGGAAAFALAIASFFPSTAAFGQSLDTVTSWDGSTAIQYFGSSAQHPALTPTFGETFVATPANSVLEDYTFYIGSSDGTEYDDNGNFIPDVVGDNFKVKGEVFDWSGNLLGGNGPQGTVGSALFTSPSFTVTSDGGFKAVTVTIAGGLILTAGDSYVIDLTDISGPSDSDFGIFGDTEFSHVSNDGGGGFNFSNFGESGNWDDFDDFGDLAFRADFSAATSTVPDGQGTAVLLCLGLAGIFACARLLATRLPVE